MLVRRIVARQVRRLARVLALTCAAAPSLAAARIVPDPFLPQGFRQPGARELARCPALDWIDYRALATVAAKEAGRLYAPLDAQHAAIRGRYAMPHAGDADVMITTVIGPGETQQTPTSTSSAIWRDHEGRWWFDRVDRRLGDERIHSNGRLAADLAQAVDRALADPCFALEPDYLPIMPPARAGHAARFGYSFILSVVRIEHAGKVRAMLQGVMTDGYRAIGDAVTYARAGAL
ncbi:MAG: hypothetical protein WC804_04365 [Sphingomonas sp.]|jgi:hypothetical protein|uniref:hypothetical protein n=1 Tax=Sphingomonas sp. TaxID=28214 RepID=UPI003563179E